MGTLNIPVGISDFEKIRKSHYYYIDKTELISELLHQNPSEITLFTRPRRFGKTLAMSMLASFFDIQKDSHALFDGLKISNHTQLCTQWMNQYPTIFVSFRRIDGLNFSDAYNMLTVVISELYREHLYLLDSEQLNTYDRQIFEHIASCNASVTETKGSLLTLTRLLNNYYHKPVILLIDEYDVPVAKANSHGYYIQMLDIMKGLMQALKDNPSLCLSVITGCLKITKESIFTGTNNFTSDTISDNRYNNYFGFTHQEVQQLLVDSNCERYADLVKQWYDGYHFGNINIYCPWDVLNYVNNVQTSNTIAPKNYWEHTSDNAIIRSFLERTDFDVSEKFETLLNGDYICENITENLTYDCITASEENLWSLLYLTGYLTRVEAGDTVDKKYTNDLAAPLTTLKIPNAEVMQIFRKSVLEWFTCKSIHSDRTDLFTALWSGDDDRLTELLSDILFDTISFHDYAESYYHAFLAGLFSQAGYIVESNYENGLGRTDITLKDRKNRRAIIIETKISKSSETMGESCQTALNQIQNQQYAKKLEHSGFKTVTCYGIAFYKKSCLVKCLR